ncbi:putative bifunctional diguanylate cyclase/phosphodiesterase [Novosphingobium kaempferiae]|uniref:putative bifunctional diguanylate cyclase/phosphodiesterase n=1 Tax=Novosphingobium kaempferiae TaxID=2896849 RepID=UPI001E29A7FE|nr:GGDEF domain-containing protein [Novosphingobium kaempferiae]
MTGLQNTILEMIATGEPLSATMVRLCREVERMVPGVICSVLTVDSAGELCTLAGPSLPAHYSSAIDGLAIGPSVGACGTAAYLGEEVVCSDIATDPRWERFRDLALPLGLRACWSSPIFGSQPRAVATFAFYYRECRGPSPLEREIVAQCVHLCAIALDRHRRVLEHERRANTDVMTGMGNRAAFDGALAELDCKVPGGWALCLVDLDNLKVVNDTFGHQAGDHVLRHVAERLFRAAGSDRVFRIGGDEFALIITQTATLRNMESSMESFLAAVSPPVDCGSSVIVPRATIGFAVCSAGDRVAERVRQNADFALYHAKETGRGGYVRYWPGIGSRMTRRLTAIRDVDAALREDRIKAHYQPIIKLETGEVVGMEALCRMHIGKSVLPAHLFHEATTDASIASALTANMIAQVAADVRYWLDLGIPFQHVGINVSSADFHNGAIYALVAEAFGKHDVPLKHVILEVTESVYMDDDAGVVRTAMAAMRAKGLKIALDDFGTGFASLTHLLQVPVDIIKIDKSFVDGVVYSPPSAAIVGGLIRIADDLGIKVVAEGVETREQQDRLLKLGCLLGQGYLYWPAMDPVEAGAIMLERGQGAVVAQQAVAGSS